MSHKINDTALKELEEAMWVSYRLCWEDFGHVLKQANAGVKFPKWLQWYLTAADPPQTVFVILLSPGKLTHNWSELSFCECHRYLLAHMH
jgi:hypothetical protein